MLIVPAATLGLYFAFRGCSAKIKRLVFFSVAMLNALQHIFKPFLYPQYSGQGFGAICTPYNMCALLILISPIVLIFGSQLWQNFIFYVGSIAGYSSILVTYWLDSPIEEQLRFVICHGLLFISSFLPLLFGIYKINYRKSWLLPFAFYSCLVLQIVTNIINFTLGIVGEVGDMTLYEFLWRENPCWSIHPPDGYGFVESLVSPFTPSAFLASKGGVDTPILWYAFPMFILITLPGFLLGILLDLKHFKSDMIKLKSFFGKVTKR